MYHVFTENLVTYKHKTLIENFLRFQNLEFLVVLESDFEITNNKIFLDKIRSALMNLPTNEMIYLQIGAGFTLEKIGVTHLVGDSQNINLKKMNLPFTNTSCAYIVNRQLANFILDAESKDETCYAIDWTLNNIFIKARKKKIGVLGFISIPELVKHGSFDGSVNSWKQSDTNSEFR